jgi:hypothetical protein
MNQTSNLSKFNQGLSLTFKVKKSPTAVLLAEGPVVSCRPRPAAPPAVLPAPAGAGRPNSSPTPEDRAACLPAPLQAAGLRLLRCVACPPAPACLPRLAWLQLAAPQEEGAALPAAGRRRPPGREGSRVQEAAAVRFGVGEGRVASRESRQGKGYGRRSTMDRPIDSFTIYYWLWAWAFTVSLDS